MIVDIAGGTLDQKDLITDLSYFGMKKLMPRAWVDMYLSIEVTSGLLDEEGATGDCMWEVTSESPRDFIIRLDSALTDDELATTLAHELVHVKQYAKNELKQYANLKGYRFKKDIYPINYKYCLRPWEIEAEMLEKTIVNEWKETFGIVLT